jgi:hypothetical protein
MPELDPGIHEARATNINRTDEVFIMDCRVKPGNDGGEDAEVAVPCSRSASETGTPAQGPGLPGGR